MKGIIGHIIFLLGGVVMGIGLGITLPYLENSMTFIITLLGSIITLLGAAICVKTKRDDT